MQFLLRVVVGAASLAVATWIVDGIDITSDKFSTQVLTLLIVSAIFGFLNVFLKPIIKIFGCAFYVVTLGLFAFVVNGCLLWLTSWVADQWNLPFHVDGFWPAVWGALIVGIVSWGLNLFVRDER
ncbi:phage holin family protein [Actinocorallia longicatena]|uniref:Phage holin family protein n=1 Tax=Actinocorallia longicatena TaxID=111803 RepID=A0ABP6QHC1_9ACTN